MSNSESHPFTFEILRADECTANVNAPVASPVEDIRESILRSFDTREHKYYCSGAEPISSDIKCTGPGGTLSIVETEKSVLAK